MLSHDLGEDLCADRQHLKRLLLVGIIKEGELLRLVQQ